MFLEFLKWSFRLILAAIVLAVMSACTMLGLNYASLETQNKPQPIPDLTLPFDADSTRAIFEEELYCPWPENLPVSVDGRRMIDDAYLDGRGTLEEVAEADVIVHVCDAANPACAKQSEAVLATLRELGVVAEGEGTTEDEVKREDRKSVV